MNEKGNRVTITEDRRRAIAWLRGVLTSMVDVAPLSPWIKRATCRLIQRAPDWLIAAWAGALNVDYVTAYQMYPDLGQEVRSDANREIVRQYVEAHDAVPVASALRQLARRAIRLLQRGKLPAKGDMIEREVCALALTTCAPYGQEFAQCVSSILGHAEGNNHFLVEYQIILDNHQKQKLERLDNALTGTRYGNWIAKRIGEVKRWLGLDTPWFNIRYGDRSPQWDILWKAIFTGGKK